MSALNDDRLCGRYWVLGGRWVEAGRQLPWPKVFGPFRDADAARAGARDLNALGGPDDLWLVVADVAPQAKLKRRRGAPSNTSRSSLAG